MSVLPTQCKACGHRIPEGKWQCPSCREWQEDEGEKDESILLSEVKSAEADRIMTGDWDTVWGGGIVQTSCTLLGGYPGAGKSTMLLQLLEAIFRHTQREAMYIATEEALPEIKARADRLKITAPIRMVPAMTGVADVGGLLVRRAPAAIILDSLQGFIGADEGMGTELLGSLKKAAVALKAPCIVISHVNKDGDYAGLMTYQHAVDTLMVLATDDEDMRTLRVHKNRYGRAHIESAFEMTEHGLILVPSEDEVEDEDESEEWDEEEIIKLRR